MHDSHISQRLVILVAPDASSTIGMTRGVEGNGRTGGTMALKIQKMKQHGMFLDLQHTES